uniref:Uncharacterized protein n=1 Tax=Rhizophora mucronata TaxID=61149 RepID=A0A2P2QDR3_RHIMU
MPLYACSTNFHDLQ